MKTVGIIAEYNPFHNGHLYQIEQIKKMTNADHVIVVMSGDYVQRGTPAFLDKYTRTKMALSHGIDAVFELPICYATASAEFFAFGAVLLLHSLGVVDTLCFGSECGDIALLSDIAAFLLAEPFDYKEALLQYQKAGETYPKARAQAISETMPGHLADKEKILSILSSPNNILGIEYIKALISLNSSIEPMTIMRKGASYHSDNITEQNASATAVRKYILEGDLTTLTTYLPSTSVALLKSSYQVNYPVTANDFSSILYYRLTQHIHSLEDYQDVSQDLANRISNLLTPCILFDDFAIQLKTKQLTLTRIQRGLLHILLNITKEDFSYIFSNRIMYARLLGFQKKSSIILKKIKGCSTIPVITKVADAKELLTTDQYAMLNSDILATHLYQQIIYSKYHTESKNEYTMGPVII